MAEQQTYNYETHIDSLVLYTTEEDAVQYNTDADPTLSGDAPNILFIILHPHPDSMRP